MNYYKSVAYCVVRFKTFLATQEGRPLVERKKARKINALRALRRQVFGHE